MNEKRYTRQLQVTQFDDDAQQKLDQAHVLIVGVGGLGSPVSLYLAGAGVGQITLIDHDVVSLSNLHRQILFTETDIDQPKVQVAEKRLRALNSTIKITAKAEQLSIDNVDSLLATATVVVDAADNFLTSYLLSDHCLKKRIPLVSASVLTTHGYVGIFCGTETLPAPSLRAVFPTPSSSVNNCNTAGVTGPSVGTIGSLQAQEALKAIIGDDSQLLGKLLYLDLWDYRQNIIDFSDAPEPPRTANIISIATLCKDDVLLDVRSVEEHQTDPVAPAVNIPLTELVNRKVELDQNQHIVCVCKSGQRALNAAKLLLDHEFKYVSVTSF